MNKFSTILRIKLPSSSDEERRQIRGILKSLLTCIYHDLQEGTVRNYSFFVRERLNNQEKRFLTKHLQVYHDNHERKEVIEENHLEESSIPSSVLDIINFYGGKK